MGFGGKEDWRSFILSWAFLWDGDVRWLVGLYISPSRRRRDQWEHMEKTQRPNRCKNVARRCEAKKKLVSTYEYAFMKTKYHSRLN